MKKLILFLSVIPFLISCNQQKIKQLELRNDSLIQQASLKDESINEFIASFNEIQYNLDSIKTKEMMISKNTEGRTELKKSAKDRINTDINDIYSLLSDTQDKLKVLRDKLGKSNYRVAELEKMVEHLAKQLQDKDVEIETLRQELEKMNVKVTRLNRNVKDLKDQNKEKEIEIKGKNEVIEEKTIEINTAFYAIGTKKSLKDNNIISSEGGFIGIGSNKKLKQDFNEDFFTKVDIRETAQIPIPGKKASVITNHPSISYEISGEGDNRILNILDNSEFWKSSKYLVVVID